MEQEDVEIPVRDPKESKGGVKYEVVLALPSVPTPPRRPLSPNDAKHSLCVEDIEEKVNAARERKKSLEAISVSQINEKLNKLQEINRKKREADLNFSESAKTNLTAKMETNKENREAFISQIVEKARSKNQHVEDVRRAMEAQIQDLMLGIQKKIAGANEAREAQISALLQKLQEHDEHHAKVRKSQKDEAGQLLEKHQRKLEKAEVNRNAIFKALQEKQVEHLRHLEDVRRKKESSALSPCQDIVNLNEEIYKENQTEEAFNNSPVFLNNNCESPDEVNNCQTSLAQINIMAQQENSTIVKTA